jgi:hypothetical protein
MDTKHLGVVAFFIIGSLFAMIMFMPLFQYQVDTQESKQTDGFVVSTDIDVITDDDDDTKYVPVIEYQYIVDSETYTSQNVYPPTGHDYEFGSRSEANAVLADYPVDSQVSVNYIPQDPDSSYLEENSNVYRNWLIASIIYAVLTILFGVWFIKVGFKRWRQRRWMKDTPTEDVESVAIGPTEIKGETKAKNDPIEAPFTDDECVYYEYEIKEYKEDAADDDKDWETVDSGSSKTPFYIDDGTGEMLVEPHEETVYEFKSEDIEERKFSSSSSTPEEIAEFVDNKTNLSETNNRRKFKQKIIKNNDTGYIFGTAQIRQEVEDTSTNSERLCIKKVTDDSMSEPLFMISSAGEKEVINRRSFALWRVPFGGILLVIAVFVLLIIGSTFIGFRVPAWV